MSRSYCVVYGCLNSSLSRPELSFFKLPANLERRSEWLRLISREDLMNRQSLNYPVCEEHFDVIDILPGTHRKKLKTNSIPSLHLPDLQKKDVETSSEAPKLIEIFTQTEENVALLASSSSQTASSLSLGTPRKRKLKSKLSACSKKLKVYEIDNKMGKHDRDIFHKLCDKFLTKELAALVKAQTHLKFNCTGNRYDQNYKMFCLNLYYNSPQAYRLLQSIVCLPSPRTLNKYGIPVTTAINDRFMSILKTKVDAMNDMEKICSVVIDAMSLKTNLFYNIKQDKIIGFHEVDGLQLPEPAKNAFVVMVRGIFINWKQPVGFALLSECRNYDEMAKWIDKLLIQLFEIGLNIRIFVSDMGSDLLSAAKKRSVTIERPYFFVNNKKIYYIFDAPHLIKLVRNNLISYDFHFQDRVAKYEHIVQFYENDSQKSFRLAHKLTNSHIHPTNFEKMKVRYATQLLSNSVAAGISTYVDFNIIEKSGRDTAVLIKNMNNLFDALNSSNCNDNYEYRRAFCNKESQITFFNEMLIFLQHLTLINPRNGKNVTSTVKFIFGFQITITSILLLFEDLRSEGCTFLLTRRLNQDVLENFFGQIRTKNGLVTEPTSRQFISAFQKFFFSNIIKPPKAGNCEDDLGKLLIQTSVLYQMNNETSFNKEKETPRTSNEDADSIVQIMSSEYNQLDITERNSLFYVCGYLLKKCAERHNCQILKAYIKPNQAIHNFSSESHYLRYREYSKDTNRSLLVVPPDDFVQYVEKMDEIFRCCFKREHINCKIAALIYKELEKIELVLPCPCFPNVYFKKLFIRIRIFYMIKFNNKAFRTCRSRRKYFSVNNL